MHTENITAPAQVEAWLLAEGRKKGWLAKQVGVNRCTLSQWLSGAYRPEEVRRVKLWKLCGVHPDAWGRLPPDGVEAPSQ